MRRELSIHFFSFIIFFLIISLVRGWFEPAYALLWLGGLAGTALPDLDHIIYALYLRPHELTSQRARSLLQKGQIKETWVLLATTRQERKNLIFHTAWFQVIFFALTFLVLSSSSNLFGKGLVLAFSLHLLVDQLVDLVETQTLVNWFWSTPFNFDRERYTFYFLGGALILLFFAIFL